MIQTIRLVGSVQNGPLNLLIRKDPSLDCVGIFQMNKFLENSSKSVHQMTGRDQRKAVPVMIITGETTKVVLVRLNIVDNLLQMSSI